MKTIQKSLVLTALLGISAIAFAQTPGIDRSGNVGYLVDSRDNVVKSGAGLCWRTGYWTPAMAIAECDPDLAKKDGGAGKGVTPASKKVALTADALFDFDKATLRPEGKTKLDDVVRSMAGIKVEVIIAVGHTDRFGTDKYNLKLSEKRAEAVKAYLVSKGVEANRVYTEGKGKKQPITAADQCKGPKSKKVIECLQPDRRVEIEVIGTQAAK